MSEFLFSEFTQEINCEALPFTEEQIWNDFVKECEQIDEPSYSAEPESFSYLPHEHRKSSEELLLQDFYRNLCQPCVLSESSNKATNNGSEITSEHSASNQALMPNPSENKSENHLEESKSTTSGVEKQIIQNISDQEESFPVNPEMEGDRESSTSRGNIIDYEGRTRFSKEHDRGKYYIHALLYQQSFQLFVNLIH